MPDESTVKFMDSPAFDRKRFKNLAFKTSTKADRSAMTSTQVPSEGEYSSASGFRDKPPYRKVKVLLVSYKKGDSLSKRNSYYLLGLKHIFTDIYHFDTEVWEIPSKSSHKAMMQKLINFIDDDDSKVLKIFYYAGHAPQDHASAMVWTRYATSCSPFQHVGGFKDLVKLFC